MVHYLLVILSVVKLKDLVFMSWKMVLIIKDKWLIIKPNAKKVFLLPNTLFILVHLSIINLMEKVHKKALIMCMSLKELIKKIGRNRVLWNGEKLRFNMFIKENLMKMVNLLEKVFIFIKFRKVNWSIRNVWRLIWSWIETWIWRIFI